MRHFLTLCLIAFALPTDAETLQGDAPGLASVINLSDEAAQHAVFANFLREEALAIREDAVLTAEEEGGASWTLNITDRPDLVTADLASVLRTVTLRQGDLGTVTVEALNWDAKAQDFFRLDKFFDEGRMREEALIAIAFRLKVGIAETIWGQKVPKAWNPMVEQATSPDVAVLSNFTLAPGTAPGKAAGLTFHFSPKEVSPAGRTQALTIPLSLFDDWLNTEGRSVFGGALRR